jgi:hypothetical protein
MSYTIALRAVYPEHDWKLNRKPSGYWSDIKSQRTFFDQLALQLHITKPEDWNSVGVNTVLNKGGSFITSYYNGSLAQGRSIE